MGEARRAEKNLDFGRRIRPPDGNGPCGRSTIRLSHDSGPRPVRGPHLPRGRLHEPHRDPPPPSSASHRCRGTGKPLRARYEHCDPGADVELRPRPDGRRARRAKPIRVERIRVGPVGAALFREFGSTARVGYSGRASGRAAGRDRHLPTRCARSLRRWRADRFFRRSLHVPVVHGGFEPTDGAVSRRSGIVRLRQSSASVGGLERAGFGRLEPGSDVLDERDPLGRRSGIRDFESIRSRCRRRLDRSAAHELHRRRRGAGRSPHRPTGADRIRHGSRRRRRQADRRGRS